MEETLLRAAQVWRNMHKDPALLSGITVGEFESLAVGTFELITVREALRNSIPVLLWVRITRAFQLTPPDVSAMLEATEELLKQRSIRSALDTLADEL